jgi:ankyrin repeat protein
VCSAKGSELSNPAQVVEKLLNSDDVEGLAMFALASSTGKLETPRFSGDPLWFAVGSVRNIEVINAVSERVEHGPDDASSLTMACASCCRELAIALLNGGCDVDRVANWTSRGGSALALACYQGPQWRDVVEFLCGKITLGKVDLPPGKRVKGAVHWACRSKSAAIVKAVCGRADVDVNRVDEQGHSGLYYALGRAPEGEIVEMARTLFDRGFTLDGERLSFVQEIAGRSGPLPLLVEFLFKRGLDPRAQVPNGETVLDVLRRGYGEVLARVGVRGLL